MMKVVLGEIVTKVTVELELGVVVDGVELVSAVVLVVGASVVVVGMVVEVVELSCTVPVVGTLWVVDDAEVTVGPWGFELSGDEVEVSVESDSSKLVVERWSMELRVLEV